MKTKLLTFGVLIIISSSLFGQLKIDAGNDTILCVGVLGVDTTEIGGNPTAIGGTKPYTYSWVTNYTIGSNSFGASYFLDDSTKSNPKIVNYAPENLKFILTVTDDTGAEIRDSIKVRFSSFAYLTMDCTASIIKGDSVSISGTIGLGIEPLSFYWSPNYNISDTMAEMPLVWPDTSMYYYVYAEDSIGCKSETTHCRIAVNTTAINYLYSDLTNSSVFPNPINNDSKISLNTIYERDFRIEIFNLTGQVILIDSFNSDYYLFGDKIFNKGLYIYLIKHQSDIISYGRFVKN